LAVFWGFELRASYRCSTAWAMSQSELRSFTGDSDDPIFCFVFGGTGVWAHHFALAKAGTLLLSNTSNPFCSAYFGDGGLTNYLSELASNLHLPDLSLLSGWNCRHEPPMPDWFVFYFVLFFLGWGVSLYCPGWLWTHLLRRSTGLQVGTSGPDMTW
jgi:hypothetical protein